MPLIDKAKFDYLYEQFPKFLRIHCGEKNPNNWNVSESNPINIHQDSLVKLSSALREITCGQLQDATILLVTNSAQPTLDEFKKTLKPFLGTQPKRERSTSSRKQSKGQNSPPTDAASRDARLDRNELRFFERYRQEWLDIFRALVQTKGANVHQHNASILRRIRKLEQFRFDRFLSPSIQWRRGTPTMGRNQSTNDDDWTTEDSQDWDRTAGFLLEQLRKAQLLIMHDDAGMGKSAFLWMLFHSILNAKSETGLAVRIEGSWPHRANSDGSIIPLTLSDILVEELLGYRENGIPIQSNKLGDEAFRKAENELDELTQQGNVYILLDGLDQMPSTDREVALKALRLSLDRQDGIGNCHWLVSGRSYAFRIADKSTEKSHPLFDERCLRFRLKKFDEGRQRKYFADLEQDPFFEQKKVAPLDYVCAGWKEEATTEDLGIPLHLSEIRRIIEHAKGPDGEGPIQEKILRVIRGSSDLHARVSDVYLERAIRTSTIASNEGPATSSEKIHVMRHICGALAMQMMLDGNFNASIDSTTNRLDSYREVRHHQRVAVYLNRCKKRYGQSLNGDPDYWGWGVNVLQQIEVTHRGDIDIFQEECRSFRDTKAMEWYAAFYLANYSTQVEWEDVIPDAGPNRINDVLGHENWTRCWQLAMELPEGYYDETHLENAIENVLATPTRRVPRSLEDAIDIAIENILTREVSRSQKCGWMWFAWQSRLEQDQEAKQRRIVPLNHATRVIANFRKEFSKRIEVEDPIALTLRFQAGRDAPDFTLENPNQTEMGWYRRIPDEGDFSMFRGERPEVVTVSPFWLRKFVVSQEEYKLFDPEYSDGNYGINRPATRIDWYMATMFCRWLGPGYRLPTEAEWEAACRANQVNNGKLQVETEYWFGDDKNEATRHMWCDENSRRWEPKSLAESVKAVGHENRWGLFDMLGNVREWCNDWYNEYAIDAVRDPVGPSKGSVRVDRGGSYRNVAAICRSAVRRGSVPSYRDNYCGFRIAVSFPSGIPE
jgi:formylglycine-generating enzyme required for sulfatase activity